MCYINLLLTLTFNYSRKCVMSLSAGSALTLVALLIDRYCCLHFNGLLPGRPGLANSSSVLFLHLFLHRLLHIRCPSSPDQYCQSTEGTYRQLLQNSAVSIHFWTCFSVSHIHSNSLMWIFYNNNNNNQICTEQLGHNFRGAWARQHVCEQRKERKPGRRGMSVA